MIERYIRRQTQDKIARHLREKEMTIVLGPRQVGKSVLLEQLQKYLVKSKKISPQRIFYFNLDIIKDWETVRQQTQFIEFLEARSRKAKIYAFIDEAQKVKNPGVFFKGLYDSKLNVKFVLTGSSSLEFASEIKESLAGRKRIFYLYPFSFGEFLLAKNKILSQLLIKEKKLSLPDRREITKLYKEYVVWGGYPRVVLGKTVDDKIAVLDDIYSSYIERDVVGFLKITNKAKFNKLVKLLAGQIGQLINIDELAGNVELDRDTVYRYLTALQETYIIASLVPYFRNSRQEIIKNPKAYFIDSGLRNYLLDDFKNLDDYLEKGLLFENVVHKELLLLKEEKIFGLHFWRTKHGAEVDFVIEKGKNLISIEAKISSRSSTLGLQNFIKKYGPQKAVLISLDWEQIAQKKKVNFTHASVIQKIL